MARELFLSEIEEQALLGHAVTDERIYDAILGLGVHLSSVNVRAIWGRLTRFHEEHRSHPSVTELRASFRDEPVVVQAMNKNLDESLKLRETMRYEVIQPLILLMAEKVTINQRVSKVADLFNKANELFNKEGGVANSGVAEFTAAKEGLQDLVTELERLRSISGGVKFQGMGDRAIGLTKIYESRWERIIPTGNTYLDDVTGGGIGVNDLWIFAAATGSGKTQMMVQIAVHAVKSGKKVAFFALEADEKEMEGRVMFTLLLQAYNEKNRGNNIFIDPVLWLHGDPETHKILAPFVPAAEAEMRSTLNALQTMYLGFGKYRAKDLERDILARSQDCDLLIIDHLGYIALDGKDDNREMQDLLFLLRDLVKLGRGVPIITACHTRKDQGKVSKKNGPLLIDRDDIMGSKSITACATAVVLIGKIYQPVNMVRDGGIPVPLPNPTIIRLCKDRRDGRDDYSAVCSFDYKSKSYRPLYGIGRLSSGDTKWYPSDPVPPWAKRGTTLKIAAFGGEK